MAGTPYNEKLILQQLAEGDEAAFRTVYLRHWNRIYTMALLYLKNPLAAQDAVQEVFEKLWLQRATVIDIDNIEAWLYILGRNYILSSLRKKTVPVQENAILPDPATENDVAPDYQLSVKELTTVIQQAVQQLPPQQKAVFLLSREEGMPLKEVAERLNISYSTAREYMSLALKSLRKYLAAHLQELPMIVSLFFLKK